MKPALLRPLFAMDGVLGVLQECSKLRSSGRALEALAKVKALSIPFLSRQEKLAIASEKFEILYTQGYYRKAETVLRKALAVSAKDYAIRESKEECWMDALLRAKLVMTQLHTTGKFESLVRKRNELVRTFLDIFP